MENNNEALKKRLDELAYRAYDRGYNTFTDYLNIDEISTLMGMRLPCSVRLYGGYAGAERCCAGFGDSIDDTEYEIECVRIAPVQAKFADKLSHRDFLGAIMNLGISRTMVGDILVDGSTGYVFCKRTVSEYIATSIDRIKHTTVRCNIITELPDILTREPEPQSVIVSSARLDAIIAGVYKLSRNDASRLIASEKVFVNSRSATKESHTLKDGDIISVRGHGKFIYDGVVRNTKKDRMVIDIRIYR